MFQKQASNSTKKQKEQVLCLKNFGALSGYIATLDKLNY